MSLLLSASRRFAIALLPFALACAQGADGTAIDTPNPAETTDASSSLQGGSVDRGHPAVGLVWSMTKTSVGLCTGTLIAPDIVLTAAHCVTDKIEGFYLGTGKADADMADPKFLATLERHAVDAQIGYPGWHGDCNSQVFDNALLHLSNPVTTVQPMAFAADAAVVGETCTAVGYGTHTVGTTQTFGQKRQGTESVTQVQSGRALTKKATATTDEGDSGGPLLCGGQIVGTVSCGNAKQGFTLYSRTDIAQDWINATIQQLRK